MNDTPATAEATSARLRGVFTTAFGGEPALVARAPGRVNLIGEHTDYNDGFVLPAAISVHAQVAARRREDGQIRVVAADLGGAESTFPVEAPFAADAAQPWADYVRGMVVALRAAGHAVPAADLAIAGTVPRGAGLSSSAALAVALGTALSELGGLAIDPTAIARAAQAAESDHVGTRCGIMDQLVSARGVADHAVLIDCRSLDCTPIPLPPGLAIMIVHSGVSRGLVEGHYNRRREQCEAVARALGVAALRDADAAMLEAARARIETEAMARAAHVVGENDRVLAAAEALRNDDRIALGQLMAASHASMRDLFAITTPEIDALVAELQQLIGREGGARMTGGGFGGAVVALLAAERAPQVARALRYRTPAGEAPLVLIEQASAGAGRL
ncbi:MAG: galactokinase [Proteobacteria bacterium]|nr:galactokinase [Pseudomonadota bacterium]